jgi:hypothetical protein
MHAVLVTVTIHDFEQARTFLTEEIVPRVSQAPGFVAGYWTRVQENQGQSMVVFESDEAARGVAEQIQAQQGEAVTMETVEVAEVVAHA